MKLLNIFRMFVLSFYSRLFYRDLAQNQKGTGLWYLFLLVLVCSIPITIKFHITMSRVPGEMDPIIRQVPDILLSKGKISVEGQQPLLIKDPSQEENPVVIIIDTTGKYTSLEGTTARLLISETKIFTRDRIFNLSDIAHLQDFALTKEGIRTVVTTFCKWFALTAFPFLLVFLYVFRILHVLIFSLISMLIAKILKVSLVYEQLMRLTAAAITPVILVNLIVSLFDAAIPFWFRLGITLGYLFFAVKANARNTTGSAS